LRSTYEGSIHEFSGPGVLLVVTWADWASTWKLLEPELEAFQTEAPADVVFRIVNVDQEPDLAAQLGAAIVPSVVIVKNGEIVDVLPNLISAEELRRVVARWLAG
jgi:thioredoxin 1